MGQTEKNEKARTSLCVCGGERWRRGQWKGGRPERLVRPGLYLLSPRVSSWHIWSLPSILIPWNILSPRSATIFLLHLINTSVDVYVMWPFWPLCRIWQKRPLPFLETILSQLPRYSPGFFPITFLISFPSIHRGSVISSPHFLLHTWSLSDASLL